MSTGTIGLLLFPSVLVIVVLGQAPTYRPLSRSSHGRGRTADPNGQAADHNTSRPASDPQDRDPRSWQELLGSSEIWNLQDLLPYLTRNGRPITEDDLFRPQETENGKRVITEGGIMAPPDECSPRNMSVRLNLNYSDPQVFYFPECTQVERCGGCTPNPNLACEPRYQERIVLKVLQFRYPYPGARNAEVERFASVEVERHRTCRLACILERTGCGPYKTFDPRRCTCRCLNYTQCVNNKVWNEDTCRCECPNQAPCCNPAAGHGTDCPMTFSHDLCECTLKRSIAGITNISDAEIAAWLASRTMQPAIAEAHFTLSPLTTSTTNAPVTQRRQCPPLLCPRQFISVLSANGRCLCRARRRG